MSSGGRPRTVTDDEIVRYLRESGERVLTTSEVAEGLDVSRRTAQRRLSALDEEGRVSRKDVGARGAVWWTTEGASDTPAAPLRRLVGALGPAAAADARERSDAWRESFDDELAPDEA
ncbi:MAG: helix-turn-helix transcriptional regulator [Haloferacaceae archaeon]